MKRLLSIILILFMLILVFSSVALADRPLVSDEVGSKAYSYIEALTFAPRVAGTQEEFAAAKMIEQYFSAAGYDTELQPFTFAGGQASQNVIANRAATKKPKTRPTPLVIVGAHYDSVPGDSGLGGGLGADDNASGVAVMLEVAERIARHKQEYDLVFVATGPSP
jgi:Zn-dependent M28 family amino/carboxypeptidase